MFFLRVRKLYPNELRADFQHYYHICIDDVGKSITATHAAALAACLPCGSLTLGKLDIRNSMSVTDALLVGIYNKDIKEAKYRINPYEEKSHATAKTQDEMEALLSRPRKAV